MEFLFSPIVLWAVGALVLLVAYQALAHKFQFRLPGVPSGEEILGKLLGAGYAKAKLKRAIDKLKKDGNFLEAGRRLEDEGELNQAIEAYTEGQQFNAAAALLEKTGKAERAGELYLQGGDYKKAAQVFSQAGKHARAAQLFQEKGNNLEAARLYGLANQWDKAAALYMKGGFAMRAAEAFEKCGEFLKAAEGYEKHFMENVSYASSYSTTSMSPEHKAALLAGRLYEKAGDVKRALEIYQRGSYFKQAAEVCLKSGDPHKAAELFMRAEDSASAADAFEKAGDAVEAANLRGEVAFKGGRAAEAAAFFQKGHDYLRAAELFESAGMLAEAAGAYEAGDSFSAAGGVYMRAGIKDRAAAAYERGGELETAAKLYEEAGNTVKAIELFDRAGHTFKSGEAAAKAGDYARAIALLQRVPSGDENHIAAIELLAESFIATGRPALAQERVQKAIAGQPASAANLSLYYWLAAAQEAAGKGVEALSVYKKIQAEDLDFRDVDKRVKRIQASESGTGEDISNKIGKYILGKRIGQGAMGEVYRAHDPALKRDVAIKMIAASLAPDSELKVRFEREAQSAARLNHPNVVTVYEFGQERGRIYLVMELLEGADLRAIINRHGLPTLGEKLAVMEQLCEGLAYAHAHDVVHRDLKPGNIQVLPNGQAKLLDFGLARLGDTSEFTQSGVILGTPNYMSPEQVRGDRVDARSDIFSLGAVFYEFLSNRKAFEADSMQGVLYQVLNDEPEPVRTWIPDLPEVLIAVIERALAKEPSGRFQNATEMKDALRHARQAIAPATLAASKPAPPSVPAPAGPKPAAPFASPSPAAPTPAAPHAATVPPASPTLVDATATPPTTPVPPAGKGARFVPQAELGRGPKGTLFRGGDSGGGQPVALRFLEPAVVGVDGAMTLLATDLKAAAALVHPNLVKLVGFVEIGGKRCVVTELIPGKNFAEPLAAGKRAPFAHVLTLARVLAETLQAIHARNLVHGGIQPANLMAAGAVVKINDLGLGRVFQNVTRARQYWPVDGGFDSATDLYAAAATVYHLLTGVNPRAQPAVAPPSSLVPGIPPAFDALLLRALDPKRHARFPGATELLAAINHVSKPA